MAKAKGLSSVQMGILGGVIGVYVLFGVICGGGGLLLRLLEPTPEQVAQREEQKAAREAYDRDRPRATKATQASRLALFENYEKVGLFRKPPEFGGGAADLYVNRQLWDNALPEERMTCIRWAAFYAAEATTDWNATLGPDKYVVRVFEASSGQRLQSYFPATDFAFFSPRK